MEDTELYSGSAIAARYGVSRSAVSNWLKREILPDECRPHNMHTGGRVNPVWTESQLPALDAWYCEEHGGRRPIPSAMSDTIEMVVGTCLGQVFYSRDFAQALIIGDDETWIARVSADGSTEEAYLSTSPLEDIINREALHPATAEDFKGLTTGFTC